MSAPSSRPLALVPPRPMSVRGETSTNELNEAAENYRRLGPLASDPVVLRETQRSLLGQLLAMCQRPPCTEMPSDKPKEWQQRWKRHRETADEIEKGLEQGEGTPHTPITQVSIKENEIGAQYTVWGGKITSTVRDHHLGETMDRTHSQQDVEQLRAASAWLDNSITKLRMFLSFVGIWTYETPLTYGPRGGSDSVAQARTAAAGRYGAIEGGRAPIVPDDVLPPGSRPAFAPTSGDTWDDDPSDYVEDADEEVAE